MMNKELLKEALMSRAEERSLAGAVRIGNSWVYSNPHSRHFKVCPVGGSRYFIKWADPEALNKVNSI